MLWKRSIMTFNFSVFSVCVISVYSSLYIKTHPIILKKKIVSFSIYSVLLHPSLLFNPDQRMIWLLKLNQLLFTYNDYYKVQLDIWIRVQFCAFIIAQYMWCIPLSEFRAVCQHITILCCVLNLCVSAFLQVLWRSWSGFAVLSGK